MTLKRLFTNDAYPASGNTYTHIISYPIKEFRYARTWWNSYSQQCYTAADSLLLKKIRQLYSDIIGDKNGEKFFKLDTQLEWRGWWHCNIPSEFDGIERIDHLYNRDTYTLPNRPNKDSKLFPLWNYANHLAKTIANWQSERAENQSAELMNDPVMLVFDETRHWLYYQLTEKESDLSTLNEISKRQSYLKSLTYDIPDFGLDKFRLHDLSQQLNIAAEIIKHSMANKELPQLLSDLTISGMDLETTLSSYLHFLLINEKVADNFSSEMRHATHSANCQHSPICKIYQTEVPLDQTRIAKNLFDFSELPKFLKFSNEEVCAHHLRATANLQFDPLKKIIFASFVTNEQKYDYLRAAATLEALTSIRKTFEKFNHLQTKIGSYLFASYYLSQTNQLAEHYIHLVDQANSLINKLINYSESGHSTLLQDKMLRIANIHFEKNLRSLDTQFAKGTTTTLQLNSLCSHAIESIQIYQLEMKKLVKTLASGEAKQEINIAMNDLYQQMDHLNRVIPVLLGESDIAIPLHPPTASNSPVNGTMIDESMALIAIDPELNQFTHETNTCPALSPNFVSHLINEAGYSALHGFLKGTANHVAKITSTSQTNIDVMAQTIYLSATFVSTFTYHTIENFNGNDPINTLSQAGIKALTDTVGLAVVDIGIQLVSATLETMGDYCADHNWQWVSSRLKNASALSRFSFFAYNTIANFDLSTMENTLKSIATSSIAMVTGIAAEKVTESALNVVAPHRS